MKSTRDFYNITSGAETGEFSTCKKRAAQSISGSYYLFNPRFMNEVIHKMRGFLPLFIISICLGFFLVYILNHHLLKPSKLENPPILQNEALPLRTEDRHVSFKSAADEIVPDLLHPGNFLKPKITAALMETAFIKSIEQIQINCSDMRRIGKIEDGGWDVCFDPPFHMEPDNCLVYSFGIKRDWSFDDAISQKYGCKVHSFDPSIGLQDHNRSDHITFHNLGLSGSLNSSGLLSGEDPKFHSHRHWKMDTLSGIRRTLGHQKEPIDYLKFDIERSELFALPTIFEDGDLWTVKQLGFELHVKEEYKNPKDLGLIFLQLLQLELIGFHKFHYHANHHCYMVSKSTGKKITRCHELYYLNTKFLNDGKQNSAI